MTAPVTLYTVPEAATALRVSKTTVYALFRRKVLRRTKVGKRTLVSSTELERFIAKSAQWQHS